MNSVPRTRIEKWALRLSEWLDWVGSRWNKASEIVLQWADDRHRARWRKANPEAAKRQDEFEARMNGLMMEHQAAMATGMRATLAMHLTTRPPVGGDTVRVPKLGTVTATPTKEADNG